MTTSASTPTSSPSTIPTPTAPADHRVRALGRVGARAVAVPSADVAARAGRCASGSVTPAVVGSAWSEPLDLEVALLEPSDWAAVPITADGWARPRTAGPLPTRLRRARRPSTGPPLRLRARRATTWLNGSPVGDEVLAPGWTSYGHRLRYRTSRRHSALAAGPNVIGMTVAEGWYRGRLGFRGGRRAVYGGDIGPIAQLELSYDDGTVETIATGAQRAHDGEGGGPAPTGVVRQPVRRRERRRAPRRAGLGDTGLRRPRLAGRA